PAAESIGLVADLEREQIRADRARYIGRLGGRLLRGAAREAETVNELPSQNAHGCGKPIDARRRDHELSGRRRLGFGAPDSALAGIAADADHAGLAERADQAEDGRIVGREIIAVGEDGGLVAEPDEVGRNLSSRI